MTRILSTLAAVAGLALLTAGSAVAAPRVVPQNFVGVNYDRSVAVAPEAVQDRQWGEMARSGAESTRLVFNWERAQPDPAAPPSFTITDARVAQAVSHGITPLPVVIYAPAWARRDASSDASPPARPEEYTAYLTALVGRYGPQGSFWRERPDLPRRPIRDWQVWNEPSIRFQWDAPDWERGYGALLRASDRALKRADGRSRTVLAGMTNRSWTDLARLYRLGRVRGAFDVAAVHPYTGRAANVLEVVRRVRLVLDRNGGRRLPTWVTEASLPAARGRAGSERQSLQTTQRGMERFLADVYRGFVSARRRRTDARVGRVYWYTWASAYEGSEIFGYAGLNVYRPDDGRFLETPALRRFRLVARSLEGCAKTTTARCR